MKQVQDVIERLWDFIDKLDINTFGELLMNMIISAQLKSSMRIIHIKCLRVSVLSEVFGR